MTRGQRTGTVFVTGGCGFVGAALVPTLLRAGHRVTVLDRMVFGSSLEPHERLTVVEGDVRDDALLGRALPGHDAVIHLAFLSNNTSGHIDPAVERAINREALGPMLQRCDEARVSRFVLASSCSVYGSATRSEVFESDASDDPTSDYAAAKLACERLLVGHGGRMCATIVRPATVCGLSSRPRLDLTVNQLCCRARFDRRVVIATPRRIRPVIHIHDLVRVYLALLTAPAGDVHGRAFNAAFENRTLLETATLIADLVGDDVSVEISAEPSPDRRSYRVSSRRLHETLGFVPTHGAAEAVRELLRAIADGRLPGAPDAPRYHNHRVQAGHDWTLRP
ncbi:MAG: SDR family oxidoreductase [Myxococcales bacterium]|nr:SDR family oxidoreductase [Myxococcales bacterium]MCB9712683.1 SDR family oxidoreductase [Myxococcales bacterium]